MASTRDSVSKSNRIDPRQREARLRQALAARGCRYTQQRGAVFAYLEQTCSHPTADQVYQAVRRELPQISLATVYKALESLVECDLATKLDFGDAAARYDCRGEDHYHLRDIETGEIRDLPALYDAGLLEKVDPQLACRLAEQGFEVTGYRLEVLGRFRQDRPGKRLPKTAR